MRKVFFCLIVGLIFSTAVFAQTLVNFNRTGTMTVAETNQMITEMFGSGVNPTSAAIDLYKISYRWIYDWLPRTRMLLINLVNDKVVIPENAAKAIETMRRRREPCAAARREQFESLNHVTGTPVVMARARRFFDEN